MTLYDRLVQDAADDEVLGKVVDRLYDRILGSTGRPEDADPLLAPFFSGIDRSRLERHMTAFLVQATGGPQRYSGRAMDRAHQHLGITGEAYDRVIHHVVGTLREFGVPDEAIDEIGGAVEPLREAVVSVTGANA